MPTGRAVRFLAALTAALLLTAAAHADDIAGTPRVIDGDTIHVRTATEIVKVRLAEVDAPERHERGGSAATGRLVQAAGDWVSCRLTGRQSYDREVGYCTGPEGVDLGLILVREGYAKQFRRFGDSYLEAEREAREAGRGLWSEF